MRLGLHTLPVILVSCLVLPACDRSGSPTAVEETIRAETPPELVEDSGLEELAENEELDELIEDKGLAELERNARNRRLTGDLEAMLERGYIRVLVPYSRTFFFYEGARPRGLAYEAMEAFAKNLRKTQRDTGKRFTMVYLPMSRDRLIPGVVEGLGDIAMAGLTATEDRKRILDFVTHESFPVAEVIVTGPGAPPLESVEDLSGQSVFIHASSSYYQSVQDLNARLRSMGMREVKIVEADANLEIEDVLELVSTGVEQVTVADDYLANFWADVMGNLVVREDLVVSESGLVGLAVRKNSPQLVAALDEFQETHGVGTLFGNVLAKRYFKDNPWVRNPNDRTDHERLEKTIPLFRKYGAQYDLDELLLVAQGYQESRLDQATQSRSGAVGVMQIKPSTAAGDPVNILDVKGKMENNIHAGVKYLRHLVDHYFSDPGITPFNQHLFAIAAYNAGPTRIRGLRSKAAAQGLDPNVWFNNVELVSAHDLGRENVEYVRKILKYWVAFRLAADMEKSTIRRG